MNDNKEYKKQLDSQDFERIRAIVDAMAAQRRNLGMSQRDLAIVCGMPQSTIARIETFKTTPNLGTVLRMMHYLGMELIVNEQRAERIKKEAALIRELDKGFKSGEENGWHSMEEVEAILKT